MRNKARFKKFLKWQKAILIFATIISILFLAIFLILPPLFGNRFDGFTPQAGLKLVISGWIGWIVLGSVLNLFSVLIGVSIDAIRK